MERPPHFAARSVPTNEDEFPGMVPMGPTSQKSWQNGICAYVGVTSLLLSLSPDLEEESSIHGILQVGGFQVIL